VGFFFLFFLFGLCQDESAELPSKERSAAAAGGKRENRKKREKTKEKQKKQSRMQNRSSRPGRKDPRLKTLSPSSAACRTSNPRTGTGNFYKSLPGDSAATQHSEGGRDRYRERERGGEGKGRE
jgi:hypothetical protein